MVSWQYKQDSLYVDLAFPLEGKSLPLDNGYLVYSALSRICPNIHKLKNLSIHPIAGIPQSNKQLQLTKSSKLQIRLPIDLIPSIYEFLAGQTFVIGQNQFNLGIPEFKPLLPFPSLYSRLVIIRGQTKPPSFLQSAHRQLKELGIQGKMMFATRANGKPQQRQLTMRKEIGTFPLKGFGVKVSDLSEEDSLTLQQHGIGGKHKMMCGVFVRSSRSKSEDEEEER